MPQDLNSDTPIIQHFIPPLLLRTLPFPFAAIAIAAAAAADSDAATLVGGGGGRADATAVGEWLSERLSNPVCCSSGRNPKLNSRRRKRERERVSFNIFCRYDSSPHLF